MRAIHERRRTGGRTAVSDKAMEKGTNGASTHRAPKEERPATAVAGLVPTWVLPEPVLDPDQARALLDLMQREGLRHGDIAQVVTHVHQGAIDVLGRVVVPQTVHQAKFSMGTVLGLIAVHGKAQLTEFANLSLTDADVAAFRDKVSMRLDPEVDGAYPARWLGRVEVVTVDGRTLHGAIDEPKGDPGNSLSRAELEDKFRRLLAFAGKRSSDEAGVLIERVWRLRETDDLSHLA